MILALIISGLAQHPDGYRDKTQLSGSFDLLKRFTEVVGIFMLTASFFGSTVP